MRLASVEKRSSPDYSRALIEQARSLRQIAATGLSDRPLQTRTRYGLALIIAAIAADTGLQASAIPDTTTVIDSGRSGRTFARNDTS